MVDVKSFLNQFLKCNVNYICGVPDSILRDFIYYLENIRHSFTHRVAVNEGGAVGLAVGYHLSSKKVPLVYMQNSGFCNAINPLISIADEKVYSIPMLILIGHRGKPGEKDEPQHNKLGPNLFKILDSVKIKTFVLEKKNYLKKINEAIKIAKLKSKPVALVVSKNFLTFKKKKKIDEKDKSMRIKYIDYLLSHKYYKNSKFLGSTGNTSRELYFLNEKKKIGHKNSFYNIGAMGHLNQIGFEIAQRSKKKVIILEGDGSLQMHAGNLAVLGKYKSSNILHILFQNNTHESTGGHLVANSNLDYKKIFCGFGYKKVFMVKNLSQFKKILEKKEHNLTAIIVKIKTGTIINLPRPNKDPKELKKIFIN